MSKSDNTNTQAESLLRATLAKDANDWENRKKLAHLLYNNGKTAEAAEVVWEAPAIPSIDLELGFAVKVLAKGAPRKAIRLLSSIQIVNQDKPAQNLALANALLHYGMVMEAARFYGAAVAQSSDLANPDLEHFLLWTDDREKVWGDFKEEKPTLGELPWMKRDAKEAALLEKTMKGHTTPIKIPDLKEVDAEKIVHEMYKQSPVKGAEPTPPPAVTIPIGRVNPKDIVIDPERGADQSPATAPAKKVGLPKAANTPLPSKPAAGNPTGTPTSSGATMIPTPQVPRPAPANTTPKLPQAVPLKRTKEPEATAPAERPEAPATISLNKTQSLNDGKITINKPGEKK